MDNKEISRVLNIIDYYINNHLYDIETNWRQIIGGEDEESYCSGFIVISKEGYSINVTVIGRFQISLDLIDRYGNEKKYLSDNEIFRKFVDDAIFRILKDSEISIEERIEKENRNINVSKLINERKG